MAATAEAEILVDPVKAWRTDSLILAGYDTENAYLLAGLHYVDLHQAIWLMQAGCDETTALWILV